MPDRRPGGRLETGTGGSGPAQVRNPVIKRKKKKIETPSGPRIVTTTTYTTEAPKYRPNPIIVPKGHYGEDFTKAISLTDKKAANIYAAFWLTWKTNPDPQTFLQFMKAPIKSGNAYFELFQELKEGGFDPAVIARAGDPADYVGRNLPMTQALVMGGGEDLTDWYKMPKITGVPMNRQYVELPDSKYGTVRIPTYDAAILNQYIQEYNTRNPKHMQLSMKDVYEDDLELIRRSQVGFFGRIAATPAEKRQQFIDYGGSSLGEGGAFMPTAVNYEMYKAFVPRSVQDTLDAENDVIAMARREHGFGQSNDFTEQVNSIKIWLNQGLRRKDQLELNGIWTEEDDKAWKNAMGRYYLLEALVKSSSEDEKERQDAREASNRLAQLGFLGNEEMGVASIYDIVRMYTNDKTGQKFNPDNSDELRRFAFSLYSSLINADSYRVAPMTNIVNFVFDYGEGRLPEEERKQYIDMFSALGSLDKAELIQDIGGKFKWVLSFGGTTTPLDKYAEEYVTDPLKAIATFGGYDKKIIEYWSMAWDWADKVTEGEPLLNDVVNGPGGFMKALGEVGKYAWDTSNEAITNTIDRVGQGITGVVIGFEGFFEAVGSELDDDSFTNFKDTWKNYMVTRFDSDYQGFGDYALGLMDLNNPFLGAETAVTETPFIPYSEKVETARTLQERYEPKTWKDPETGEVHYRSGHTWVYNLMDDFGMDPETNPFAVEVGNFAAEMAYLGLLDKGWRLSKAGQTAAALTGRGLRSTIHTADIADRIVKINAKTAELVDEIAKVSETGAPVTGLAERLERLRHRNVGLMKMLFAGDDKAAKALSELKTRDEVFEWLKNPKNRALLYRPDADFHVPAIMMDVRIRMLTGGVEDVALIKGTAGSLAIKTTRGVNLLPVNGIRNFLTRTWAEGPVSTQNELHRFTYDAARIIGMSPDEALTLAGRVVNDRINALEMVKKTDILADDLAKEKAIYDEMVRIGTAKMEKGEEVASSFEEAGEEQLKRVEEAQKALDEQIKNNPDELVEKLNEQKLLTAQMRIDAVLREWYEKLPAEQKEAFNNYLRKKSGKPPNWSPEPPAYLTAATDTRVQTRVPFIDKNGKLKWKTEAATIGRGGELSRVISGRDAAVMRKTVNARREAVRAYSRETVAALEAERTFIKKLLKSQSFYGANVDKVKEIIAKWSRVEPRISLWNKSELEMKTALNVILYGDGKTKAPIERAISALRRERTVAKGKKKVTVYTSNVTKAVAKYVPNAYRTKMEELVLSVREAETALREVTPYMRQGRSSPFRAGQMAQWYTPPFSLYDIHMFRSGKMSQTWEIFNRRWLDTPVEIFKHWVLAKFGTMIKIVLADEFWRLFFEGINPAFMLRGKQVAFDALAKKNPSLARVMYHLLDSNAGHTIMRLDPKDEKQVDDYIKNFAAWADSNLLKAEPIQDYHRIVLQTQKEARDIALRVAHETPGFRWGFDAERAALLGADDAQFAEILKFAHERGLLTRADGTPLPLRPDGMPLFQTAPMRFKSLIQEQVATGNGPYADMLFHTAREEATQAQRRAWASDITDEPPTPTPERVGVPSGTPTEPQLQKIEDDINDFKNNDSVQDVRGTRDKAYDRQLDAEIELDNTPAAAQLKAVESRSQKAEEAWDELYGYRRDDNGRLIISHDEPIEVYRGVRPGGMVSEKQEFVTEGVFVTRNKEYADKYTKSFTGEEPAEGSYVQRMYLSPDSRVYVYTGAEPAYLDTVIDAIPTNALADMYGEGSRRIVERFVWDEEKKARLLAMTDDELMNLAGEELKYRRAHEVPDLGDFTGSSQLFKWAKDNGYDAIEIPAEEEFFVINKDILLSQKPKGTGKPVSGTRKAALERYIDNYIAYIENVAGYDAGSIASVAKMDNRSPYLEARRVAQSLPTLKQRAEIKDSIKFAKQDVAFWDKNLSALRKRNRTLRNRYLNDEEKKTVEALNKERIALNELKDRPAIEQWNYLYNDKRTTGLNGDEILKVRRDMKARIDNLEDNADEILTKALNRHSDAVTSARAMREDTFSKPLPEEAPFKPEPYPVNVNMDKNADAYWSAITSYYESVAGPGGSDTIRKILSREINPMKLMSTKEGRKQLYMMIMDDKGGDALPPIWAMSDLSYPMTGAHPMVRFLRGETWPWAAAKHFKVPFTDIPFPGFYSALDGMSRRMKGAVFMQRYDSDLKHMLSLGFSEEEASRIAINHALQYAEEVMYSSGKYMVEQGMRNMVLFAPAYRQFVKYWGKKMFTDWILMFGLLDRLNGERYRDMLSYEDNGPKPFGFLPESFRSFMPEGMLYSFGNLSFLTFNDKFSEDNWWTQVFPGYGPLIMGGANLVATAKPEWRDTMSKIPGLQYVNPDVPPNPAWNDLLFGFTSYLGDATGLWEGGLPAPLPEGDVWSSLFPGTGRPEDYYERRYINDMIDQMFSGELPNAEQARDNVGEMSAQNAAWNIFSPVARHYLFNDDMYRMNQIHEEISMAKNEDEIQNILAKPENAMYRPIYEYLSNKNQRYKIAMKYYVDWVENGNQEAKMTLMKIFALTTSMYVTDYNRDFPLFDDVSFSGILKTPEQWSESVRARFESLEKQYLYQKLREMANAEVIKFNQHIRQNGIVMGSPLYNKMYADRFGEQEFDNKEITLPPTDKLESAPALNDIVSRWMMNVVNKTPTFSGNTYKYADIISQRKPSTGISPAAFHFFNYLWENRNLIPEGMEILRNSTYFNAYKRERREWRREQMGDFMDIAFKYPTDLTDYQWKQIGLPKPTRDQKIDALVYLYAVNRWKAYSESPEYEFNSDRWRAELRKLHGWQEWLQRQGGPVAELVTHGPGWRLINGSIGLADPDVIKPISDTTAMFRPGDRKVIDEMKKSLGTTSSSARKALSEAKKRLSADGRRNLSEYVRAWGWRTIVEVYAEPYRNHLGSFWNETMDWRGTSIDSKEGQKYKKRMERVLMSFLGYHEDEHGRIIKGTPISKTLAAEIRAAIKATYGDIGTLAGYLIDPYRL